jgi:putative transposase
MMSGVPPRFADLFDAAPDDDAFIPLRRGELIGRPLGAPAFPDAISGQFRRTVTPGKRRPKPKAGAVVPNRGKAKGSRQ